jgi:hypothetical protein
VFDTEIIQHKISLKPGSKPIKEKFRQFNPLLLPIIEKELKRLLEAKIIVPLRYSEWVANLVPCQEEERRDKALCGLQESKQVLFKRQ